jgi:hypothetical protein
MMNPVIGDGALQAIGKSNAADTTMTEKDKVSCHLLFALNELKGSTSSCSDPRAKEHRFRVLHALEQYIEAGNFPQNEKSPNQRYPCFVDSRGTACAVAHMMLETGAAQLVRDIAYAHKHDTIAQIAEDVALLPRIQTWATTNGVDLAEVALIQPTYEFEPRFQLRIVEDKLKIMAESNEEITEDQLKSLDSDIRVFCSVYNNYGRGENVDHFYAPTLFKLTEMIPNDKPELKARVEKLARFLGASATMRCDIV